MATRPEPGQERRRDPLDFTSVLQERREGGRRPRDPLDFSDVLRRRGGREPEEPEPTPRDTARQEPSEPEEGLFQRFLSFFEREGEVEPLGAEPPEEERETILGPMETGALSPGAQEDLLEAAPETRAESPGLQARPDTELELERALHEELTRRGMESEPPDTGLERTPAGSLYDPETGRIESLTPAAGPPTSLQRTETEPEPGVRDIVTREEQMAASPELRERRRRVGDTSSDVSLSIGRNLMEAGMATGIGLGEMLQLASGVEAEQEALEGLTERMRATREDLRDYYGEAETTAGKVAGVGARLAGELSQFVAPELLLTRLGTLPKTVSMLRRIGREAAIGAPIDAMIAASDRENSMAGFAADLAQESEDLPEGWAAKLDDIANTEWKRALFDSFVGSALAAGAVPVLDAIGRGINRVARGSASEGEQILREARIRSVTDDYRAAAQQPGGLETVPLGVEDLRELDPEVLRGVAADLSRKLQAARSRGIVDAATERDLHRLHRALEGVEGGAERGARARGGGEAGRTPSEPGPGTREGEIGPQTGAQGLESGLDVSGPAPRSLEEQQAELEEAMRARIEGLEEEAGTDPLTELPNRRGEQRALERRPPPEGTTRVQLMADVDNFKAVNDRLSQEAGDRYLQELARIMEDIVREEDAVTLARVGGDEFRVTIDAREGTDIAGLQARLNDRVNQELAARGMDSVEDTPLGVTFFEPGQKTQAKRAAGRSRAREELEAIERRPPPAELAPPQARDAAVQAAARGDVEAVRRAEGALTEAGDRGRRPPVEAEVGPRGELPSRDVFALRRSDIDLDPDRFQYKTEGRQTAGRALEGVEDWDYTKAGVMSVWWDEDAGRWFVVNGHNRMGLANRVLEGDEPVNVMELHAASPKEARAMGAMQNIAEGRGTAVDAAKFFRDGDLDAEKVAELNIPMTENKVQKGLALARLHPAIFDDVVQKRVKLNRAVIIGESGLPPEQQLAIHRSEDINDLNQGELEELIRVTRGAGSREVSQQTLFGKETFQESNLLERVKISRRVKRELARDRRVFGPLARESRASRIEQKGAGQIERKRAGELATEAEQFEEVYNSLSTGSGPVTDILNRHARAVGAGEKSLAQAADDATEEVKDALRQFIEEGNLRAEVQRAEAEGAGVRAADAGGAGPRPPGDGEGVPGGGAGREAAEGGARGVEGAGEPIPTELAARIDQGEVVRELTGDRQVVELPDGGFVAMRGGQTLTESGQAGAQVFDDLEDAIDATTRAELEAGAPGGRPAQEAQEGVQPATEQELTDILLEGADPEDAARAARSLQNTRTGRLLEMFDREIREGLTPLARAQLQELASRGEDVTSLLADAERVHDVDLFNRYQRSHLDEQNRLFDREAAFERQRPGDLPTEGTDDLELFERASRAYDTGEVTDEIAGQVRQMEAARAGPVFGSEEAADQVAEEVIQTSLPFSKGTIDGVPARGDRLRAVQEGAQRRAWVDIREQVLESAEDVHRALFPFRHPKAERLHYIYLDDEGRVLGHTMDTAGAINAAGATVQSHRAVYERARRLGASEIVMAHNHPSGSVHPSPEDKRFLMQLRVFLHSQDQHRNVRNLAGGERPPAEVLEPQARGRAMTALDVGDARPTVDARRGYIIDHDQVHELELHGLDRPAVEGDVWVKDRTHKVDPPPGAGRDWTHERGPKVTSPGEVADLVGRADRPKAVDLVFMDGQSRVVAVEPHNSDFLRNLPAEAVEQRARAHGAGQIIFVTHGERAGDYADALLTANRLRTDKRFQTIPRDVVAVEPGGGHYTSAASDKVLMQVEDPPIATRRVFERSLPEGEEVDQAAIYHPGTEGRWEGSSHFDALQKVPDDIPREELVDGYTTSNNRFVTRKEAFNLEQEAGGAGQFPDMGLAAEELRASPSKMARDRAERAVEEFGTTEDPFEAGYILRDGKMLDFSGRRLGRGTVGGTRSMDHRRVAGLYDETFEGGDVEAVFAFEGDGNIRLSVFDDLVRAEFASNLTGDQIRRLQEAAREVMRAESPPQSTQNHLILRVRNPKTGEVVGQLDRELTSTGDIEAGVRQVSREAEENGYDMWNLRELSRGRADIPEGLSDEAVLAATTYPAAPRSIATDRANHIRDVAEGLKEADPEAIEEAAEKMAPKLRPGARLIPIPDHTGNTEANRALAQALARRINGEVADVLRRVPNEESSFARRRQGEPGLTADEIRHELAMPAGDLENAVLVDNVVTTGATATSARRALGEEVPVAAWAKDASVEHRRRLELNARRGGRSVRESPSRYGEEGPIDLSSTAVVDETGEPATVFHGTNREFEQFSKGQASRTSLFGPGYYFTDDPRVASSYARKSTELEVVESGLSREEARRAAQRVNGWTRRAFDDPSWEVVRATPQGTPNVRPARLMIENPYPADEFWEPEQLREFANRVHRVAGGDVAGPLRRLRETVVSNMRSGRGRHSNGASTSDIYEYLVITAQREGGARPLEARGWVNDLLQEMGYDGIRYRGGIRTGNRPHTAWVAFDRSQVRSPYDDPSAARVVGETPEKYGQDMDGGLGSLRESSEAYGREAGLRPAVRVEGRIFEGQKGELHVDLLNRMPNDESSKAVWAEERGEGAAGWVDEDGNFLTREEAAERLGQTGSLHADMLDDQGRIEDTLRERSPRYGQGDFFGSDAPAEGGDQFRMFGEEGEEALEGLSAAEIRARDTVLDLQGKVDSQRATPEELERYNEAVKLLRRDYPVKTDELVNRARQEALEEGPPPREEGQRDIFGPEAGVVLPKVLRTIAASGTGGTIGALLDDENPWRGAAIGAVLAGGLVKLPGAWTDVMAGRQIGMAERVEQAAQAAARGEPPGAPRYRGSGRAMTEAELEEAVNFEKFDTDPTGQARLEEEVKRVGAESGVKTPHKVVSMDEAAALAEELGLDPSDILPNLGERMTGVELTALGNIVTDNIRKTVQILEALNHPALTREQEEILLRNLKTRENQNNFLLEKIMRGRSQKGRDLAHLRLTAMGSRDPQGNLIPEPFYIQAKRFLGNEAFTTEHASTINRFIAEDDLEGLAEYISSLRKHSLTDKVVTLYKANLMSAPITQIRNLVGNTSMAVLETVKDVPAYVGDRLLSLAFDTGLQAKAAPRPTRLARASWEGIKKGAHEAEAMLRTGIRIDDAAIKYDLTRTEVNFNNVFVDVYTKAIFRGMMAGDRLFKGPAFMRALDEMAQVTALNEGLERGTDAFKERVAALLKAPTDEMAAQAIHDAEIATFTNRNILGDIGVNIKRQVPLMEGVIPFTNTPANIALRTVDYSPFGFLRTAKGAFELAKASADGITDAATRRQVLQLQRQVANDFGRNVIGTMGVAALGYKLAESGLMTGAWPSDRATQREWQRRGIQSNAIYIPEGAPGVPEEMQGSWNTIENISPWGNIMAFGANVYGVVADPETTGATDIAAGAGVSIATTVSEQSFLTGLSDALSALNNPERASGDAFRRTVASFLVPNIVKKVSESFDPHFRESETLGEDIGRRLPPVARVGPLETPAKLDEFGRPIERPGGLLKSLFDPFNMRTDRALEDEVIMELSRTGTSIPELQKQEDETREEFRARQEEVGQRLYVGITELMNSGPYRAIPQVVKEAIEQNADLRGRLDPDEYARELQQGLLEDVIRSIRRGTSRRMQVEESLEGIEQGEEVPGGRR